MPEDSPDTRNRIASTVEDTRRDLAREFERSDARPGGLMTVNVDVRSPDFEAALPELLAASSRNRLAELRGEISRLGGMTEELRASTDAGTKTAQDLLTTTRRLFWAAVSTLGVALVTLAVAILQVTR